jgi:hypothetical protein
MIKLTIIDQAGQVVTVDCEQVLLNDPQTIVYAIPLGGTDADKVGFPVASMRSFQQKTL